MLCLLFLICKFVKVIEYSMTLIFLYDKSILQEKIA